MNGKVTSVCYIIDTRTFHNLITHTYGHLDNQ